MIPSQLHLETLGLPGPDGTLVFVHATGLNGLSYIPMLRRVDHQGEILIPTLRGHGADRLEADPDRLISWELLASDLLETLSERKFETPLILAGHSAGAVTALMAARQLRPSKVLMIEPVVLPRLIVALCKTPLRKRVTRRIPIAKKAAARRADFPSKEAAKAYYQTKSFFRDWEEAALDGYLAEGLTKTEQGVTLSCNPAWESAMFKAQAGGFWPHLSSVLQAGVEVSILGAAKGSTFPRRARVRAAKMGAHVVERDSSHMIPVESPNLTARWITDERKGKASSTRV